MKLQITTIALLSAMVSGPALAQQKQDHADHQAAAAGKSASLADGEVRKIDKEAKKLTIRHGPIANLDMPAMTMVFQVADASVLDSVKVGDKIRFNAEKSGGVYTVTRLEVAK